MKKIKDEELKRLQDLHAEFNQVKSQIGDAELQKQNLILKVHELKDEFTKLEKGLMETYGHDAVINLETGEVKKKENGENK